MASRNLAKVENWDRNPDTALQHGVSYSVNVRFNIGETL